MTPLNPCSLMAAIIRRSDSYVCLHVYIFICIYIRCIYMCIDHMYIYIYMKYVNMCTSYNSITISPWICCVASDRDCTRDNVRASAVCLARGPPHGRHCSLQKQKSPHMTFCSASMSSSARISNSGPQGWGYSWAKVCYHHPCIPIYQIGVFQKIAGFMCLPFIYPIWYTGLDL